ncbi:peptidase C47 [Enterococcus faecalis]|nr:peptidase C47 [Enterococcus faecalis]EHQ8829628.1 C39 family peptidase [Enterococcus faecalis]
MKKYILGIGLFLTSLLFGINASAMDGDNTPLFIQTKEVPSELRMYAQQDWQFYFENLSVVENTEPLSTDDFYLGQPFTLTNETDTQTAYFPIIDKESGLIHDLLEVSLMNNTPSLTISSQFVELLNRLTPTAEGTSFSLNLDSESHQLLSAEEPTREQAVDIKQSVDNFNRKKRSVPDDTVPEYNRNIIPNWMITETQGLEPWCAFYTLSTMINSIEGKAITNAKTLIKKAFRTASEAELVDGKYITSKPFAHTVQTMQKEYGYTLDIKNSRLTPAEVQTQIDKNAPVYVHLDNVTQNYNPAKSHGVTVIGYIIAKNNTLDSYYYFWNPWWQKVMLTNQKDMSNWKLNDNVYSWKYSGINFRKEPINYAMKGKIATLLSRATYYQTGEKIPTDLRNKEYIIKDVKSISQSSSKVAYYLEGINKWVLEQDVKEFPTPLLNKKVTLLSKASQYQTGEAIPTNVRNKQYTALKVKPFRRSNSKLAYFLSGINKWVLEQDIR